MERSFETTVKRCKRRWTLLVLYSFNGRDRYIDNVCGVTKSQKWQSRVWVNVRGKYPYLGNLLTQIYPWQRVASVSKPSICLAVLAVFTRIEQNLKFHMSCGFRGRPKVTKVLICVDNSASPINRCQYRSDMDNGNYWRVVSVLPLWEQKQKGAEAQFWDDPALIWHTVISAQANPYAISGVTIYPAVWPRFTRGNQQTTNHSATSLAVRVQPHDVSIQV